MRDVLRVYRALNFSKLHAIEYKLEYPRKLLLTSENTFSFALVLKCNYIYCILFVTRNVIVEFSDIIFIEIFFEAYRRID